jgi:hypothetical protein
MEVQQQEINAHVNLLVPSKMGYLHYVQDGGLREVHSPWLGDYPRLLPLHSSQIPMMCEHVKVLAVSQVEVTYIQRQNLILLRLACAYPLREVRSNQGVV